MILAPEQEQLRIQALVQEVRATKFDYLKKVEFPEPILSFFSEGKRYPVGGKGMIGGIVGPEKSGKTFVSSAIAESHLLGGSERMNFEIKTSGSLMWLDTEQSAYFFDLNQRRIHTNAGLRNNSPNYEAYLLRKWAPEERLAAIENLLYSAGNTEVLIIDGIVDLLSDYNDLKKATEVMGHLMRWSFERNILLLGILHLNKGDNKIRGHLGSEFKNKCDFILQVTQPKRNEYELTNPTGRFLTFPDMAFRRNEENGAAEYLDGKTKSSFL